MAINTASPDVKSVPLTTFGGVVTNLNPVALPQGGSPDCSDCSFLPSGVFSRACFQKALATPLGAVTLTYGKSYVDSSGIIRDFYLDSAGNFWMEIIAPSNLAAVPTVIFTTTPGSSARSITANGREYVAIHNPRDPGRPRCSADNHKLATSIRRTRECWRGRPHLHHFRSVP
jgi:hypothetical protein